MHWTLWLWCYTSYKIRLIFWIEILIRFSGEDDWYDDFRNATSVVYTLASIHIWFGCPSVISRFPCQSAIVSYWRCAIQYTGALFACLQFGFWRIWWLQWWMSKADPCFRRSWNRRWSHQTSISGRWRRDASMSHPAPFTWRCRIMPRIKVRASFFSDWWLPGFLDGLFELQ